MLYSPALSFFRIILMFLWVISSATLHFIISRISKKYFFVSYNLFFHGLIRIFGIKIRFSGSPERKKTLFVSNHISYLDILILGSSVNALFVAKSEIKKWPVINKLCSIGKTIFVKRKDLRNVKGQMSLIEENLKNGFNIILFPEGTSSDGCKVLDFKSSLFGLVEIPDIKDYKIQPISISYSKLDGLPLDKIFRPFLAWFGEMDLLSHAWKFLGLGISEVEINFLQPKKFSFFSGRKQASKFCHTKISDQVIKDSRSLEIDDKIKLSEFKLL